MVFAMLCLKCVGHIYITQIAGLVHGLNYLRLAPLLRHEPQPNLPGALQVQGQEITRKTSYAVPDEWHFSLLGERDDGFQCQGPSKQEASLVVIWFK